MADIHSLALHPMAPAQVANNSTVTPCNQGSYSLSLVPRPFIDVRKGKGLT